MPTRIVLKTHTGNMSLEIQGYIFSNTVVVGNFDTICILANQVGKKKKRIMFKKYIIRSTYWICRSNYVYHKPNTTS